MDINSALKRIVLGSKEAGFFETLVYMVYRDAVAKPGSTAIDIGAHKGLHTFRLADCVGARGRVFAFEPVSELADGLEDIAAQRYPDDRRVIVKSVALSDKEGEATFYRNAVVPIQGAVNVERAPDKAERWGFSVEVSSLDKVFGPDRPKYVSVIKIDTESAEYRVLNGARALLSEAHPLIVMGFTIGQLRLAGKTPEEFFKLLDDLDYIFFNIDGSEFNREFVASGREMHCNERFGAKRGHWIETFLREKMSTVVERHIKHFAAARGLSLEGV